MSSERKNLFMPVNRPSGLYVSTLVSALRQRGVEADSLSRVRLDRGLALEHNDAVGEVRGHDLADQLY